MSRNWDAVNAQFRKAGPMKSKRRDDEGPMIKPGRHKGGAANHLASYLEELEDEGDIADEVDSEFEEYQTANTIPEGASG